MDLDLECQLNWIRLVDPKDATLQHIKRLRRDNEIWFEENANKDQKTLTEPPECNSKCPPLLLLSSLDFLEFGGNAGAVEERLNHAKDELESCAEFMNKRELRVQRYLILANKAVLKFRRLGKCAEVEKDRQEAADMLDLTVPKLKASLLHFKAGFLSFFAGITEKRVMLSQQVVELDPSVYKYWVGLFLALRELRKPHRAYPTPEEMSSIGRAYELAPKSGDVLLGMTGHYFDIYKYMTQCEQKGISIPPIFDFVSQMGFPDFVTKMKLFARLAHESNPSSTDTALLYAEILWCAKEKSTPAEIEEAKIQFDICLRDWPKNASVLDTVGKFYCCSFSSIPDVTKGMELLFENVKNNRSNVHILIDYLRYCSGGYRSSGGKVTRKATQLIEDINDSFEHHVGRKLVISALHCLKATLLAHILEYPRALNSWMEAIKVLPDFWDKIDQDYLLGRGIFGETHNIETENMRALRNYVKSRIQTSGRRRSGESDSEHNINLKNLLLAINDEIKYRDEVHKFNRGR